MHLDYRVELIPPLAGIGPAQPRCHWPHALNQETEQ